MSPTSELRSIIPERPRRSGAWAFSLLAHAAVLTLLAWCWGNLTVEQRERPLELQFRQPASAPAAGAVAASRSGGATLSQSTTPPVRKAIEAPTAAAATIAERKGSGEANLGNVSPLEITTPLGVADAAPQEPPERPAPEEPLTPGEGGVSWPELLPESVVPPTYPRAARIARQEGRVLMSLTIDPTGAVSAVELLEETPPDRGFAAAAEAAVRLRRYRPAIRDGRPVAVRITISFPFRLQ